MQVPREARDGEDADQVARGEQIRDGEQQQRGGEAKDEDGEAELP